MKIVIDHDERYPFYTLKKKDREWQNEIEVPDEFVAKYDALIDELDSMEEQIEEMIDAANYHTHDWSKAKLS